MRSPSRAINSRPSGLNATALTSDHRRENGAESTSSDRPVCTSQTRTVRSRPPVTSRRPSGLNARPLTGPSWPRNVAAVRACQTDRERDVMALVAQGKTNEAIADSLHLHRATVEKHINAIFLAFDLAEEKQVNKRVAAVLLFLRDA